MTKNVRVENACGSNWPVRVTVQDRVYVDGKPTDEWKDASMKQLDYPTALAEIGITSSRRLIVEERPADPPPPPTVTST